MSKSKKTITEKLLDAVIGEKVERDFSILEALIKDDFCNYKFEVTNGVCVGDKHGVTGSGIVMDSLKDAMAELSVHFAILDDVFKHAGVDKDAQIEVLKSHELAFLYAVTGFKIKNNYIILTGSKYLSMGGRVSFDLPRVCIDELSSYKWYNELKESADKICEEVALYKEGNYIPVEIDESKEDPGQLKMSFVKGADDNMDDFKNAAE